jgi:hypothetical protein
MCRSQHGEERKALFILSPKGKELGQRIGEMFLRKQQLNVVVALTIMFVAIPRPSYAYIDYGTGSMAIQALFAILAGALLVFRKYWGNIRLYLSKLYGADRAEPKNRTGG